MTYLTDKADNVDAVVAQTRNISSAGTQIILTSQARSEASSATPATQ